MVYSKLKVQNPLKIPKKKIALPSHPRMKKLLLVATVIGAGMAFSHAGINISIGLPLPPLPRAIVIQRPVVACPPPVIVAPPACPPRVVVPCPPPVYYQPRHGHGHWNHRYDYNDRRSNGRGHGSSHGHRR